MTKKYEASLARAEELRRLTPTVWNTVQPLGVLIKALRAAGFNEAEWSGPNREPADLTGLLRSSRYRVMLAYLKPARNPNKYLLFVERRDELWLIFERSPDSQAN